MEVTGLSNELRLEVVVSLLVLLGAVTLNPSGEGLPGADFVQQLLNWGGQVALWGSLGAMVVGAAVWGWANRAGNSYQAGHGRAWAIGGGIGAALTALAPAIVNALFSAAGAGSAGTGP